jgi:hypothetical protein
MEEEETPGSSEPQVTVRNSLRRPLTFRVGGKTIRLSPGEALALDESLLLSSELQHFCSSGVVRVTRTEVEPDDEPADDIGADAEDAGEGEEGDSPASGKQRKSKGSRTQKPTGNS